MDKVLTLCQSLQQQTQLPPLNAFVEVTTLITELLLQSASSSFTVEFSQSVFNMILRLLAQGPDCLMTSCLCKIVHALTDISPTCSHPFLGTFYQLISATTSSGKETPFVSEETLLATLSILETISNSKQLVVLLPLQQYISFYNSSALGYSLGSVGGSKASSKSSATFSSGGKSDSSPPSELLLKTISLLPDIVLGFHVSKTPTNKESFAMVSAATANGQQQTLFTFLFGLLKGQVHPITREQILLSISRCLTSLTQHELLEPSVAQFCFQAVSKNALSFGNSTAFPSLLGQLLVMMHRISSQGGNEGPTPTMTNTAGSGGMFGAISIFHRKTTSNTGGNAVVNPFADAVAMELTRKLIKQCMGGSSTIATSGTSSSNVAAVKTLLTHIGIALASILKLFIGSAGMQETMDHLLDFFFPGGNMNPSFCSSSPDVSDAERLVKCLALAFGTWSQECGSIGFRVQIANCFVKHLHLSMPSHVESNNNSNKFRCQLALQSLAFIVPQLCDLEYQPQFVHDVCTALVHLCEAKLAPSMAGYAESILGYCLEGSVKSGGEHHPQQQRILCNLLEVNVDGIIGDPLGALEHAARVIHARAQAIQTLSKKYPCWKAPAVISSLLALASLCKQHLLQKDLHPSLELFCVFVESYSALHAKIAECLPFYEDVLMERGGNSSPGVNALDFPSIGTFSSYAKETVSELREYWQVIVDASSSSSSVANLPCVLRMVYPFANCLIQVLRRAEVFSKTLTASFQFQSADCNVMARQFSQWYLIQKTDDTVLGNQVRVATYQLLRHCASPVKKHELDVAFSDFFAGTISSATANVISERRVLLLRGEGLGADNDDLDLSLLGVITPIPLGQEKRSLGHRLEGPKFSRNSLSTASSFSSVGVLVPPSISRSSILDASIELIAHCFVNGDFSLRHGIIFKLFEIYGEISHGAAIAQKTLHWNLLSTLYSMLQEDYEKPTWCRLWREDPQHMEMGVTLREQIVKLFLKSEGTLSSTVSGAKGSFQAQSSVILSSGQSAMTGGTNVEFRRIVCAQAMARVDQLMGQNHICNLLAGLSPSGAQGKGNATEQDLVFKGSLWMALAEWGVFSIQMIQSSGTLIPNENEIKTNVATPVMSILSKPSTLQEALFPGHFSLLFPYFYALYRLESRCVSPMTGKLFSTLPVLEHLLEGLMKSGNASAVHALLTSTFQDAGRALGMFYLWVSKCLQHSLPHALLSSQWAGYFLPTLISLCYHCFRRSDVFASHIKMIGESSHLRQSIAESRAILNPSLLLLDTWLNLDWEKLEQKLGETKTMNMISFSKCGSSLDELLWSLVQYQPPLHQLGGTTAMTMPTPILALRLLRKLIGKQGIVDAKRWKILSMLSFQICDVTAFSSLQKEMDKLLEIVGDQLLKVAMETQRFTSLALWYKCLQTIITVKPPPAIVAEEVVGMTDEGTGGPPGRDDYEDELEGGKSKGFNRGVSRRNATPASKYDVHSETSGKQLAVSALLHCVKQQLKTINVQQLSGKKELLEVNQQAIEALLAACSLAEITEGAAPLSFHALRVLTHPELLSCPGIAELQTQVTTTVRELIRRAASTATEFPNDDDVFIVCDAVWQFASSASPELCTDYSVHRVLNALKAFGASPESKGTTGNFFLHASYAASVFASLYPICRRHRWETSAKLCLDVLCPASPNAMAGGSTTAEHSFFLPVFMFLCFVLKQCFHLQLTSQSPLGLTLLQRFAVQNEEGLISIFQNFPPGNGLLEKVIPLIEIYLSLANHEKAEEKLKGKVSHPSSRGTPALLQLMMSELAVPFCFLLLSNKTTSHLLMRPKETTTNIDQIAHFLNGSQQVLLFLQLLQASPAAVPPGLMLNFLEEILKAEKCKRQFSSTDSPQQIVIIAEKIQEVFVEYLFVNTNMNIRDNPSGEVEFSQQDWCQCIRILIRIREEVLSNGVDKPSNRDGEGTSSCWINQLLFFTSKLSFPSFCHEFFMPPGEEERAGKEESKREEGIFFFPKIINFIVKSSAFLDRMKILALCFQCSSSSDNATKNDAVTAILFFLSMKNDDVFMASMTVEDKNDEASLPLHAAMLSLLSALYSIFNHDAIDDDDDKSSNKGQEINPTRFKKFFNVLHDHLQESTLLRLMFIPALLLTSSAENTMTARSQETTTSEEKDQGETGAKFHLLETSPYISQLLVQLLREQWDRFVQQQLDEKRGETKEEGEVKSFMFFMIKILSHICFSCLQGTLWAKIRQLLLEMSSSYHQEMKEALKELQPMELSQVRECMMGETAPSMTMTRGPTTGTSMSNVTGSNSMGAASPPKLSINLASYQ